MIIINELKELEKYKSKITPIIDEDFKNIITYEFKENGKLADLTLNIEIPFGLNDLDKERKGKIDKYTFIAHNVYANKKLNIGSLKANSLTFKNDCQVVFGMIVQNIRGTNLNCKYGTIISQKINCKEIEIKNLSCYKLKAKLLIIGKNCFYNIKTNRVDMFHSLKYI